MFCFRVFDGFFFRSRALSDTDTEIWKLQDQNCFHGLALSQNNTKSGNYFLNFYGFFFQGLALSQKDAEIRELQAQLHQTELNNTLQQDLLKHMINDRVDIEVDNLMTNVTDGMFYIQI